MWWLWAGLIAAGSAHLTNTAGAATTGEDGGGASDPGSDS
jgi:hypothetical protein